METSRLFAHFGLGKNAHKVYLALLASRTPLVVAHIAASAHIDRPEVYRNLTSLLKRGFVLKSRRGKRFVYEAANPQVLETAAREEIANAANLTNILSKRAERDLPRTLEYFRGPQGIRAIFDDVVARLPRGGSFYRYTSERDLAKVNKYLSPEYRAKRDKKKLERLVISNPTSGKQKRPRLERFIKYIPQEFDRFEQDIIQLVYHDSVAFIDLAREEGFIVRDLALAEFQSVIFRMLYRKL